MAEEIHIWKGPKRGEPIAGGCSVLMFTILTISDSFAAGIIQLIDHMERGIVFTSPWKTTKKENFWEIAKKDDGKDRLTEECIFTLSSEINDSIKEFVLERIKFFLKTRQKEVSPLEMNQAERSQALKSQRLFKANNSFLFAAQIPDDSVGCSGSRCSNCGNKTAYCNQRCFWCGFPFIGPFGFPQISEWELLSKGEKGALVEGIYHQHDNGRMGYVNVDWVPLTEAELSEIELLDIEKAHYFKSTHSVSPKEIRKTLFRE